MAFAALSPIAAGAFNIGKKIVQGIKDRKAEKAIVKTETIIKAAKEVGAVFGVGSKAGSATVGAAGLGADTISSSGNTLAAVKQTKGETVNPVSGAIQVSSTSPGGGINPLFLLGGAFLLLFLMKRK